MLSSMAPVMERAILQKICFHAELQWAKGTKKMCLTNQWHKNKKCKNAYKLEDAGFEPATSRMRSERSTPELNPQNAPGPNDGNVGFYH